MLIIVAIVTAILGLAALNFALLYWRSIHEGLALAEYVQFILMQSESYQDQRVKFAEYLASTAGKTSERRGLDAARAVTQMAKNLRPKLTLANIGWRNELASGSPGRNE